MEEFWGQSFPASIQTHLSCLKANVSTCSFRSLGSGLFSPEWVGKALGKSQNFVDSKSTLCVESSHKLGHLGVVRCGMVCASPIFPQLPNFDHLWGWPSLNADLRQARASQGFEGQAALSHSWRPKHPPLRKTPWQNGSRQPGSHSSRKPLKRFRETIALGRPLKASWMGWVEPGELGMHWL